MLKYQELMKEYNVTFESDVLDKAFISKAKDLEEKIKNNQLTEEEIQKADDELVELFNTLHEHESVDSEELAEAKYKETIAEAKAEIAEASTLDLLNELKKKFKKLPEVQSLLDSKIKKFQETENSKVEQEAKEKLFKIARKEIAEIDYNDLGAIGKKYEAYPELVGLINKRIEDERKDWDDKELAVKLRAKKEWSYHELKALGITPTGEDMTVAGVKLYKEWMFNIYSTR